MKLFASISLLLCLLPLGACSTNRALLRTEVVYLQPSAGLLQKCRPPELVPSRTNGDIVVNSLNRQTAYDYCNILHQCLLDWHVAAKKVAESKGKAVPTPISCGQLIK